MSFKVILKIVLHNYFILCDHVYLVENIAIFNVLWFVNKNVLNIVK